MQLCQLTHHVVRIHSCVAYTSRMLTIVRYVRNACSVRICEDVLSSGKVCASGRVRSSVVCKVPGVLVVPRLTGWEKNPTDWMQKSHARQLREAQSNFDLTDELRWIQGEAFWQNLRSRREKKVKMFVVFIRWNFWRGGDVCIRFYLPLKFDLHTEVRYKTDNTSEVLRNLLIYFIFPAFRLHSKGTCTEHKANNLHF